MDRVVKKSIYTVKGEEDQVKSLLGTTRLDMILRTGHMLTESSQHFSEYIPYYSRTNEIREKYGVEGDIFRKNIERKEKNYEKILENSKHGIPTPLKKSVEYGSAIINLMVTGLPSSIYANVMNYVLETNLPAFCAVEVLSIVYKKRVHPCCYEKLPTHLAVLCQMQKTCNNLQ